MSTRRARIKAVTALPPRRKNIDKADGIKKQEEKNEDLENETRGLLSSEKTHKDQSPQEQTKESVDLVIEPSNPPLLLSKDTTAVECLQDTSSLKSPEISDTSIDETPKPISGKNTLKRPLSSEKAQEVQPDEKAQEYTAPVTPNLPDIAIEGSSSKPVENKNFVSNQILKGLLNAAEKPPRNIPQTTTERAFNITSAKDQEMMDNTMDNRIQSGDKETMRPNAIPFFASPRGRASPRPSIVRTPIIEVDLIAEKCIAPHKGPNSVGSEMDYIETHAAEETIANKEVEVTVEKINDSDVLKKMEEDMTEVTNLKDPVQIIDEYAIQPLPQTSTVMDGIVPLKSVSKTPLEMLKNEIISENAEVLFDPIVPLPSPSKVRPKLRPAPILGPRRNSFQQGSASESEDENRRLHARPSTPVPSRQRHDSSHTTAIVQRDVARVRNDSICSTVSQAPSQAAAVGSPLREREKSNKSRREEMTARRNAAMRKRQSDVERDKLTMYDLIFYNPTANPIIPDQDEIKAKEANKKEEEERKAEASKPETSKEESSPEAAPVAVPQIKLGPDGEIVVDEQSLVVKQSGLRTLSPSVVREGAWGGGESRAYRRTPRTADWSDAETVRFYRALAAMGTDFSLMQPLFPTRSRRDLKLKFKKEERLNLAQVDMALRSGAEFDPDRLEREFTDERKAADEAQKKAKEKLKREKELEKEREREKKKLGLRSSKCSKPLGDSSMPERFGQSKAPPATLDEYVKFQEERKRRINLKKSKKRKQADEPYTANMRSMRGSMVPAEASTPLSPSLATLTLLSRQNKIGDIAPQCASTPIEMATITQDTVIPPGVHMPDNIEIGSLVVLSVNDPKSPSRRMLQTYIAQGPGHLTPVSLPPNFLSTVVDYMKRNKSPRVNVERPGANVVRPGVNVERPGGNAVQPGVNVERPGVIAVQPGVNVERPGVNAVQPGVNVERPGVNAVQPGVNVDRPGVNNVRPIVNVERPPRPGTPNILTSRKRKSSYTIQQL